MGKKLLIYLLVTLLLSSFVFSQENIIFQKNINQSEVFSNSKILVNIFIQNMNNKSINFEFNDYSIPYLSKINSNYTIDKNKDLLAPTNLVYIRNITLNSKESINFSYEMVFLNISSNRLENYEIIPKAQINLYNNEIYSNEISIYLKGNIIEKNICDKNDLLCQDSNSDSEKNIIKSSDFISNLSNKSLAIVEDKNEIDLKNQSNTEQENNINQKNEDKNSKLIFFGIIVGIIISIIFIFLKLMYSIRK